MSTRRLRGRPAARPDRNGKIQALVELVPMGHAVMHPDWAPGVVPMLARIAREATGTAPATSACAICDAPWSWKVQARFALLVEFIKPAPRRAVSALCERCGARRDVQQRAVEAIAHEFEIEVGSVQHVHEGGRA